MSTTSEDKRAVYQAMSPEAKIAYLEGRLADMTVALDSICNRTHGLAGTLALLGLTTDEAQRDERPKLREIAAKLESGVQYARERSKPPAL